MSQSAPAVVHARQLQLGVECGQEGLGQPPPEPQVGRVRIVTRMPGDSDVEIWNRNGHNESPQPKPLDDIGHGGVVRTGPARDMAVNFGDEMPSHSAIGH